jgi:hypothetical protein
MKVDAGTASIRLILLNSARDNRYLGSNAMR